MDAKWLYQTLEGEVGGRKRKLEQTTRHGRGTTSLGKRKCGRSCVGVSIWTCVHKLYSCQHTPYSLHFLSYNEAAIWAASSQNVRHPQL